jgi:hypothetical protein
MRFWRLPEVGVVVGLFFLGSLPVAAQINQFSAPESLQPGYSVFEAALTQQSANRVSEGRYDWGDASTQSGGGTLSLGKEYRSSDPAADCGACQDPCRRFRLSARSTRGFGEYVGVTCLVSGSWSIRSIKEEAWTAIAAPEIPAPPVSVVRTAAKVVDTSTQSLALSAMLQMMTSDLATLGYIAADASATEAAYSEYARDHLDEETDLSALKVRNRQNAVIANLKARSEALTKSEDIGFTDSACRDSRKPFEMGAYPYSTCVTNRAQ